MHVWYTVVSVSVDTRIATIFIVDPAARYRSAVGRLCEVACPVMRVHESLIRGSATCVTVCMSTHISARISCISPSRSV